MVGNRTNWISCTATKDPNAAGRCEKYPKRSRWQIINAARLTQDRKKLMKLTVSENHQKKSRFRYVLYSKEKVEFLPIVHHYVVFWTWLVRLCIFGCNELHSFVSDLVCCDLVFWGCWLPFAWLTSLMGNGWCHWERSHRFPRRAQATSMIWDPRQVVTKKQRLTLYPSWRWRRTKTPEN